MQINLSFLLLSSSSLSCLGKSYQLYLDSHFLNLQRCWQNWLFFFPPFFPFLFPITSQCCWWCSKWEWWCFQFSPFPCCHEEEEKKIFKIMIFLDESFFISNLIPAKFSLIWWHFWRKELKAKINQLQGEKTNLQ